MTTDKILTRVDGAIAHLIFNNPERHNAVSLEMWEAVDHHLRDFEANRDIRVVILSGAGGKAFVSGADISKFESERASAEAVARYGEVTTHVHARLSGMAVPTIARIDGYCVGGGVGLALCCDMRICGAGSKFAVPAAKLGLGYAAEGVRRLMDVVGPSYAKEIFFTARLFDAQEAQMMGLVNRVVPDDQVETYVNDYAERITANAPLTIKSVKTIVGEMVKDPRARDMDLCDTSVQACFDSQDYVEGRRAFMEKRPPEFKGR